MTISNILKGVTGEFEITRVLGATGVGIYIVAANAFEVWNMARGSAFDVVAYCAAFPTGLGVAVAAVGTAAGVKDKSVAQARAIENQVAS